MSDSENSKVFTCKRCGYCCHGETTVSLDKDDQQRMLKYLEVSEDEAFARYWRKNSGQVQMKTVNGHCIFFNNGCSVHIARPWRCREWPLVKAITTDPVNFQTISSSCPGIGEKTSWEDFCRALEMAKNVNSKPSN